NISELILLYPLSFSLSFFFFFQAEDGIRDRNVTGVQTCALPISTDPIIVTSAPILLAATAWFAPFPPGYVSNFSPKTVSPCSGTWLVVVTISILILPTMQTRGCLSIVTTPSYC